MKTEYSPTYTTIVKCPESILHELADILSHNIEEDQLKAIQEGVGNTLPFTKAYAFRASKDIEGTYTVTFYSGFLVKVIHLLMKGAIGSTKTKYIASNPTPSDIMYDHQGRIVRKCLGKKRGIVKSPTGSGKSYVIAELATKLYEDNCRVLITVPTITLLNQMSKDIRDYWRLNRVNSGVDLDTPYPSIGFVGDGSYDFQDITIGIPNSLCKDKCIDYLNTVDALIADEVHTCANGMYGKVIEGLTNRVLSIGLSATPGEHILLEGFFGPRILEIKESEMISKDIIMQPLFEFHAAPAGFIPPKLANQANKLQSLTDAARYKILAEVYNYAIIRNQARNEMIVNSAISRMAVDLGPVLIIVNKVKGKHSHADILVDMLARHDIDAPVISGYISKKKKEKLINELKENTLGCAIAGPKILSAGVSIHSLSTIILAGAGRSDSEFIQRVGRLLRKKEGKERPLVIDYQDPQFWFASQSRSRIQTAESIYGAEHILLK